MLSLSLSLSDLQSSTTHTRTNRARCRRVAQVGGLGAPLLRHLLPHRRHPRRRAQRQARPHPRDLGAPEGARAPPAAGARRRLRLRRHHGRVIPPRARGRPRSSSKPRLLLLCFASNKDGCELAMYYQSDVDGTWAEHYVSVSVLLLKFI